MLYYSLLTFTTERIVNSVFNVCIRTWSAVEESRTCHIEIYTRTIITISKKIMRCVDHEIKREF